MVSGRRPFDAESPMEALTQRLTRDPRPLGSAASEVPPDLALAVDRCLQRDVTKRWPDAKSLREALLPSDEESEDSLSGRLLRTSVTIGLLMVLAFGYVSVYSALNPNFRLPLRGIGLLVGPAVPMVILAFVATIGLRSEGLDGRSILMKAFQQPRRWRSCTRGPFDGAATYGTVSRTSSGAFASIAVSSRFICWGSSCRCS